MLFADRGGQLLTRGAQPLQAPLLKSCHGGDLLVHCVECRHCTFMCIGVENGCFPANCVSFFAKRGKLSGFPCTCFYLFFNISCKCKGLALLHMFLLFLQHFL